MIGFLFRAFVTFGFVLYMGSPMADAHRLSALPVAEQPMCEAGQPCGHARPHPPLLAELTARSPLLARLSAEAHDNPPVRTGAARAATWLAGLLLLEAPPESRFAGVRAWFGEAVQTIRARISESPPASARAFEHAAPSKTAPSEAKNRQ